MLSELDVRKLVKGNNRSVHVTNEFVTCLIYKECKFDPRPNDDGSSAAGPMQIMPPAISDVNRSLQAGTPHYKPSDVNDDAKCIQMATLYIDLRIRSFGGDITKGIDHYGTGPIDDAGYRRERFADRHMKSPEEMSRLFAAHPEAVVRSSGIAARCTFSLAELTYQYPDELQRDDETPQQGLERLERESLPLRYAEGMPPAVQAQLAHKLRLIGSLGYAP